MTYLVELGEQTFVVNRKEAVSMSSVLWTCTEAEAYTKISVLEKVNNVSTVQCLKIA